MKTNIGVYPKWVTANPGVIAENNNPPTPSAHPPIPVTAATAAFENCSK